jgi:hypothetical protein
MENKHICQDGFSALNGMREFYNVIGVLPTSENADITLIRSHIAYWGGSIKAEKASIKPSRGYSYRVAMYGKHDRDDIIVKIADYYDHRDGVVGYR